MSSDFQIPLQRDDLLKRTSINQYVVDEVYPLRVLPSKLQESRMNLRSKGPTSIIQDFDTYYSILKNFNSVAPELREDAWETLLKAMQGLVQHLTNLLEHEMDREARTSHLNTVKMICYLVCQFMELFESESSANPTIVKGRKPKKSCVQGSIDWDYERENGVRILSQLAKVNIHRLWDPPVLEDEFVGLMTGCCYKLLENPMGARGKVTRDHMFHLLGIFIKKYNHTFSCTLKMIQLLQHFEHLISPLAGAVQLFVEQFGMKNIVGELMREMGRMDVDGLARDLSGTRAYSAFLVEVSEKVPSAMLSNISLLLHFLDEEPYSMRNAVLGILGELVIQVLNKDDLDPKLKITRDQFLDNLEDHIIDTNAFVRNKTIQVLVHISNSGAMPLARLHSVLEMVVGRLKDKSSQVRKSAMQFITASLQGNPFAAKLSIDELVESCEKESAKLKEMLPEVDETIQVKQEVSAEHEFWASIEARMKEAITCIVKEPSDSETSSVEISDDDSVSGTVDKISSLVKDQAYKDAVRLLVAAHETFSVEPTFNYEEEQDDTEPEDPFDDRNDEENVKIRGILACMQDIILGQQHLAGVKDAVGSGEVIVTGEEPPKLANDITKQQVLVKYLQDSVKFAREIQNSIPVVCQLLGSKTTSDVMESINFFVMGYEFGITNAIVGVRAMLSRIWAKESAIKDAVVVAYKRLYLKSQSRDSRTHAVNVVANLSPLTVGASIGDMTSLEELVCEFVRSGDLGKHEIQVMWERFTMKIPNTTEQDSSAALMLLSMAAGADPAIVKSNINVLVKEGLGPRAEKDFILPRFTCAALLKIAGTAKPKAGTYAEAFRLPKTHDIFKSLSTILVNGAKVAEKDQWIPLCAQGVNVIYRLAERPDAICGEMIKQLAEEIMASQATVTDDGDGSGDNGNGVPNPQCSNALMTRFLFLSGHVAFAQMVHLDTSVFCELKRRTEIQEQGKDTTRSKTSTSKTPKGKSKTDTELTAEEEMGLTGATADDAEAEYIRRICETEVVTGNNLIGVLRPLILAILNNPTKFSNADLQASAAMALAKFMMVSSEFCENHLQLLFTILEKSPHAVIRGNTIIAVGDLTVRFPNLAEPWTPNLYKRLRDESSQVRKNTVQVLTHLILKNMLKVKGHISEMAICIVDHNDRISGLAKLFFHELAKKGNAVYNVMPDIISRLSDPDAGIDEEHFQIIMRYLFSFIQKDKQCESLVEKLCHRFRAARVDRQSTDLAFCLSLLSYNDKSLLKLQENFVCFADKLGDVQIYQYFLQILSGAKKFIKQQTKTLIEELEQRMEECHSKGAEEADIAHKAKGALLVAKGKKRTPRKTPAKTPGRRGRAKSLLQQMQEEMDADSESEELNPAQRRGKRRPLLDLSDDDSDVFEETKGKAPLAKNGEGINDLENHDPNVDKGGGKTDAAEDNPEKDAPRPERGRAALKSAPVKEKEPPAIKKTGHKSVSNKANNTAHSPPTRRNVPRRSSRRQ